MKISKLFHWLYATLMFLPLVFFIPSVFYYGFNEHATNTETTTINYKYESNEVNTDDDLIIGNLYELDLLYFVDNSTDLDNIFIQNTNAILIDTRDNTSTNQLVYYSTDCLSITNQNYHLLFSNDNGYANVIEFEVSSIAVEFYKLYFTYNNTYESTFTDDLYYYVKYTDYNVIESVSVNIDDTITDKLNMSWNAIFDLPMFSWTKTTFVSGAFVYISGLFGVQANNPLNYLFAYFVSISICWLVFDVLLYVPNLAHRWLDKGAIE